MRRQAKASTAGSTERQATGLGGFFRGPGLTRAGHKGTGASKARGLALLASLPLAVVGLGLGASGASAAAPTISSTFTSVVTTKTALLEAQVNPEGEATTYRFEYGTADCSSNPCTSGPVGNVGSGSVAIKVSNEISGLQPDTAYHFRVLATNGSGTVAGPDRVFSTYAIESTKANCPNQEFRTGFGARLQDCRAYEMVSPVDKNGGNITTNPSGRAFWAALNQSTPGGDKFTYSSNTAFGDAVGAPHTSQYMATRGADGWTTHGISAPHGNLVTSFANIFVDTEYRAFTSDLSAGFFLYHTEPLTPDAPDGWVNYYKSDLATDSYQPFFTTAPTFFANNQFPQLGGISADGEHAAFGMKAALTPDANPGTNNQIYDWTPEGLRLASILPNGTPTTVNAAVGASGHNGFETRSSNVEHAVSDDGSRIFWTNQASASALPSNGKIFVRVDGVETLKVSEIVSTSNAMFRGASSDGSLAAFTVGESLYVADVDAQTARLVAGGVPGVAGISDDLSRIYFVSSEDLAAGATAGQPNLYLDDEGAKEFIATLSAADTTLTLPQTVSNISPEAVRHVAKVTSDGSHLAFMSTQSLTGYDNVDSGTGEPVSEVYLYDAVSDELDCASCNPSGARPSGSQLIPNGPNTAQESKPVAAGWLPTWLTIFHAPRALSENGQRLFFNSFDALVPQDTNGAGDVYQWEAEGSGTCQRPGGCVSLISTGQSPEDSEFFDASVNGDDVFFRTLSSIDSSDDGLIDVYDARVNGGFPVPPPPPIPCIGDACQGIPAAPNDPTPASASFRGSGDPQAPRKARRCRAGGRSTAKRSARRGAKKAKRPARRTQAKRCTRGGRRAGR